MPDEILLFTAPFLECSKCRSLIPLPYGELPRITPSQLHDTEVEGQIVLPPDEWKATFGCLKCAHVSNYDAPDIVPLSRPRGDARGYHDAATLFVATFPCAKMHCKSPATVYTNIESGGAAEYLRLLRSGFFQGKLSCGHDISAVPEAYYKIDEMAARLW
jgi:hypothetical protein